MAKANKPDPEPVIKEVHEYLPRRRALLLGYIATALLVAVLLVFGARAIYRHSHKPTIKTVPTSTNQQTLTSPVNNSGAKSDNQSTAKNDLPNSGPGQVIGLFIASSLAAAGLHFVLNLRKNSRTD